MIHVIGIDPGLRRGTGLGLVSLDGQRRRARALSAGVFEAYAVREWCETRRRELEAVGNPSPLVCIETMAAMGPVTGGQKILDNAEFVGEIIGRLSERGFQIVKVKKLEVLRGIGLKGKANPSRVRRMMGILVADLGACSDHAIDACAAAVVGARKARLR